MLRPLVLSWAVALLVPCAVAQIDARSEIRSITSPVQHAGIFHVGTGTWTRGASLANAVGPDVVYDNTCATGYFVRMRNGVSWQHRSRLPSASGPTTASLFYGTRDSAHRWDERPGCADSYRIDGFQVGYCSSHVGTLDWEYQFASSYSVCGLADMVPDYLVTVTGMPGGSPAGAQQCWTVDVDLSGSPGGGILLAADGDGTFSGPSTANQFGFGFRPLGSFPEADFTGPILAGDFTWTGGPGTVSGVLAPCTGTDGTIWDRPIDLSERGTGMSSNDFFRQTGLYSPPSGAGCYYFGGNPHADFHLELYADVHCPPDDPVVAFCAPGVDGLVTCPCGNPQVPAGSTTGCDNFVAPAGGGVLSGAGNPVTNPGDTLQFNITGGVGTSVTVLFQGTTSTVNTRTGAGVRCVGGTLNRLYKGNPVAGAISFPNNGVKVHDQSALKGFVINAPVTLFYFTAYRNSAANGQPGCPGLNFGFNASNAGAVEWIP